jgi:hypothetical protein
MAKLSLAALATGVCRESSIVNREWLAIFEIYLLAFAA